MTDPISNEMPALPAPDDGLVVGWAYDLATNISYEDGKPHYGGWEARISFNEPNVPEGSIRNLRALREAATALQSQAEQIERLTRERDEALTDPYKVMGGIYEKWKARADAAEQQVQKLTADKATALGLLNHLIAWIVHECGAEVPFTEEQDAAFASLETQEGGK